MGTTIRVEPEELDGDEPLYANFSSDAEIDRYRRLVGTSRYRAIELNWGRVRGVFTVGRKLPR